MAEVMLGSEAAGLALPLTHSGKVRDMYELPGDRLLMVATDRVSAFDVVLPTGIERKGEVLTRISAFWFARTAEVVPNHMIAVVDAGNAAELGLDIDASFFGRSMVVRRAEPLKVEAVVRGYITGSGWTEYRRSGTVCGIALPEGLQQCERLAGPIFTPTTKAEPPEHDEPMTYEQVEQLVGAGAANAIKLRALALYRYAAEHAAERGVIIADTKFEFGMLDGEVTLIDELLTPDSSRFWPADRYEPGRDQPSFDKQPLRDWLAASGWDKTSPAPELPPEVAREMSERYMEAYQRLTGEPLAD